MTTKKNSEVVDEVQQPSEVVDDDPMRTVTLRDDVTFEYHLTMPQSVLDDIMDPLTPTRWVEVPMERKVQGTRRYLNTMYVKTIDVRE